MQDPAPITPHAANAALVLAAAAYLNFLFQPLALLVFPALVLGHRAVAASTRRSGAMNGRGRAAAALVLGYLLLATNGVLLLLYATGVIPYRS